jgi:pantoate--beta-alanine ligase
MKIIRNSIDLKKILVAEKSNQKSIGFIPTMGALHEGHLSLIECAQKENDKTIVSIFVNPTQFNNLDDLEKYPRNEKEDIQKLETVNCSFVFIPTVEEMYPDSDNRHFEFNGLDTVMEGKHRPGHFRGVALIVSKLFMLIQPNKAYFGKKDFQQLAIINHINKAYLKDLQIEIVACDIIREPDGLAMSSRNERLSESERKSAGKIYSILKKYTERYNALDVNEIKSKVKYEINSLPELETEYIEIVDNKTLCKVDTIVPGRTTACIAVFAGKIRLIDNYSF